jgi:hypothetical protein
VAQRRRALPLVLLVVPLGLGGIWFAWPDEVAPSASSPAVTVAPELPSERVDEEGSESQDDGGEVSAFDAGGFVISADAGTEAERAVKRWRDALEPLFKSRKGNDPVSAKVATVAAELEAPDAGVLEDAGCRGAVTTLPLQDHGTSDFLIAIDTSGSMRGELNDVVNWVSALELALKQHKVDFQLIVVADQGKVKKTRESSLVDGGKIQAEIGSQDTFETLIRSATTGPEPRWPQLLRPNAVKHLVVVTDDDAADKRGLPYLPVLANAAGGALGTAEKPELIVHLLGGFEPPTPLVMASVPPVTKVCRGGVRPGLGYQRVVRKTGGLRGALCSPDSLRAMVDALAAWPLPNQDNGCIWMLPLDEGARVVEVKAPSARGGVFRLYEARTSDACTGRKDAWRMAGRFFALCQSTCASLREGGYEAIEVHSACGR